MISCTSFERVGRSSPAGTWAAADVGRDTPLTNDRQSWHHLSTELTDTTIPQHPNSRPCFAGSQALRTVQLIDRLWEHTAQLWLMRTVPPFLQWEACSLPELEAARVLSKGNLIVPGAVEPCLQMYVSWTDRDRFDRAWQGDSSGTCICFLLLCPVIRYGIKHVSVVTIEHYFACTDLRSDRTKKLGLKFSRPIKAGSLVPLSAFRYLDWFRRYCRGRYPPPPHPPTRTGEDGMDPRTGVW